MTAYRRVHAPGATYFFTVALAQRGTDTLIHHLDLLRQAYAKTKADRPFHTEAVVILPDHLHAVWTLPEGDTDYGTRWGAIKARFTRALKARMVAKGGSMGWNPILRSPSKVRKADAGVWQRRFWEHTIRDQADLDAHIRYCWTNPVKHGFVDHPTEWAASSIHRDIRRGTVPPEWNGTITEGDFGEAA